MEKNLYFHFTVFSSIVIVILFRQKHSLLIKKNRLFPFTLCHPCTISLSFCDISFDNMMKGIYKGFKYITQIFVVKEQEIEIGYPTDVKHVAHIGWDGPSGTGPSWMNKFKTAPDFSTSIGSFGDRRNTNPTAVTSSQPTRDFEESSGRQETGVAHQVHKKPKRKKMKPNSSPKSSSRHPRSAKSKATAYCELEQQKSVDQD